MSDLYRNKYRIPSIRLQNWDYSSNAAYYVTICTHNREYYFGNVVEGKMILSNLGIIADVIWHEIVNHAKNVELGPFIVMPNHIHGILMICNNESDAYGATEMGVTVETRHALSLPMPTQMPTPPSTPPSPPIGKQRFQNQGKNTLSSIIGSYKSAISKHAHRLGFRFQWQSRFYDIIIRNDESFKRISDYIINNPSKWKNDNFFVSPQSQPL